MPTSASPTDLLDAAFAYAARGWRIIPLYAVVAGQCTCSRRRRCKTPGKHPPVEGWGELATTETAQIEAWWRQCPQANVGIVTGHASGIAVLDIDPRHGGDINLEELQQMYARLPETPLVLSGGGGWHYYFATHEVLPSCDLAHGIQFQVEGRLMVAPPSLHASGKTYTWEVTQDPEDIPLAPLPDWVRALALSHHQADIGDMPPLPDELPALALDDLRVSSRMKQVIVTGADPDQPQRYPSRSEAVSAVEHALIGAGHDDATIAAVLLNPAWRISDKPRSQRDPRSPRYAQAIRDWVAKDIHRARMKHQQNGAGHPRVAIDMGTELPGGQARGPAPLASATAPWREHLLTKKNGEPTCNVGNIGLILANHPTWAGRFWWDAVRGTAMLDEAPFTDEMITTLAHWLHVHERLAMNTTKPLKDCLMVECHKQAKDLLQIWLNGLPPWDGTARLSTWLAAVTGAPQDAYTAEVGRALFVSMVARALQPGCQCRFVVIFQGDEEIGKSTLVRELAGPDWYVELSIGLETKEAHMMLQGAWVAELSELDSLTRTEETRLKAFITMREDSYIPKYSNFRQRTERRAIFVGTTNDESFLKGQSGNTRYLPIYLPYAIRLEEFRAMREQLFAEALLYYYAHSEHWWQLSPDALETAKEEREKRRVISVFEHPLHEWLEHGRFKARFVDDTNLPVVFTPAETSWQEIARWYLQLDTPEKWKDKSLQLQIASALKGLGWRVTQVWKSGRNTNIWRKDNENA